VKIAEVRKALEASVLAREDLLDSEISDIYASDLMSDVLAFGKPDSLLLTGLASQQSVISAHMAEFKAVVLIRGKKTKDAAERFAREHNIVLLSTQMDMYDCCVRTQDARAADLASPAPPPAESILLNSQFVIEGSDFSRAGLVSTEVKSVLKKIGIDPGIVRRVAISTYEGEMNVIMHAKRARVRLSVTPNSVEVVLDDEGKGIPDVEQAMQEGYTTATEEQRAMGFGSGMGLPNIKRNSDQLDIASEVGRGTRLRMLFMLKPLSA
jgi:serine/threonine-protein kinase RsbT